MSVLQKSNFRRSIQLLELLGEGEEEYKVSLYTAVHRVMCQANPTLTRRHLHNVLHPDKPAVNNLEQVNSLSNVSAEFYIVPHFTEYFSIFTF